MTSIIAADNARFAQPEIRLGIIPGAGGTQRLPRAIGKAKAMDWLLTGRMIDASEAERAGLISRVVPAGQTLPTAMSIAAEIAAMPLMAVMALKESVQRAYDTPLTEGLRAERRLFTASSPQKTRKRACRLSSKNAPRYSSTDSSGNTHTSRQNNRCFPMVLFHQGRAPPVLFRLRVQPAFLPEHDALSARPQPPARHLDTLLNTPP